MAEDGKMEIAMKSARDMMNLGIEPSVVTFNTLDLCSHWLVHFSIQNAWIQKPNDLPHVQHPPQRRAFHPTKRPNQRHAYSTKFINQKCYQDSLVHFSIEVEIQTFKDCLLQHQLSKSRSWERWQVPEFSNARKRWRTLLIFQKFTHHTHILNKHSTFILHTYIHQSALSTSRFTHLL